MENFGENSPPKVESKFRGTTVYKPNNQGTGTALAFDARLPGGCFVGVSSQLPGTKVQDARFNWEGKVVAKFGPPDLQRFIVSYKQVRDRGQEVPTRWRPKPSGADQSVAFSVGAFHRPPAGGSLVWQYDFQAEGGIFKLSKQSPDNVVTRASISLDLGEEWLLLQFFELVIAELLVVGG